MTAIRDLTLTLRYQVYADYATGDRGVLVNAYSNPRVAERAVKALTSGPGTFVERAWSVDSVPWDY